MIPRERTMGNQFVIKNGVLEKYSENDSQVTIPDSVTSIGRSAFSECTNLKSVTIPDNVKIIKNLAFCNCQDITLIVKAGSYAEQYAKKKKKCYQTY